MNTKIIPTVAVVIVVAGIAFAASQKKSNTESQTPSPTPSLSATPSNSESVQTSTPTDTATTTGSYIDYKEGVIESTAGTKILFFHAAWCSECRALEKSIKSGSIPANTTIIKVDYDSNQALRKTYEVTLQTTLVRVNDSGELVKKFVAYEDPSLDSLVKNLL